MTPVFKRLTFPSVVAAMGAQLYFFNNTDLTDQTYARWPTVLSEQIVQNLAIITACLPVLNPFIIKIIAGKIEPEEISYTNSAPPFIKRYFERKSQTPIFDSTTSRGSHASITPLTENTTEPYCRPLATYGLDLSSNHRLTHSSSHFALNIAKPIFTPSPLENVFNRHINIPASRPATSTSAKDPLAAPTQLDDVGVLPTLEWETESSSSGSRRSSPARHPTAEWVGIRQKVISVPEEEHLYDDESKRFFPPLPSPRCLKKPPRAF